MGLHLEDVGMTPRFRYDTYERPVVKRATRRESFSGTEPTAELARARRRRGSDGSG